MTYLFIIFSVSSQESTGVGSKKADKIFIGMFGGKVLTAGEYDTGLGLKFGFEKSNFGRLGFRFISTISKRSKPTFTELLFLDYEYPAVLVKGLHFVPNCGFGIVANYLGVDFGLSLEFQPLPWLALRLGADGFLVFSENAIVINQLGSLMLFF